MHRHTSLSHDTHTHMHTHSCHIMSQSVLCINKLCVIIIIIYINNKHTQIHDNTSVGPVLTFIFSTSISSITNRELVLVLVLVLY